eukprot:g3230.t1
MAGDEGLQEFLVLFAHHNMYFNMRFQELEALAALQGILKPDLYVEAPPSALNASPAVLVRMRQEDARKICERAVLVKAVLEVWSLGHSCPEAVQTAVAQGEAVRRQRRRFLAPPLKLQLRVEAFGRTLTVEARVEETHWLSLWQHRSTILFLKLPPMLSITSATVIVLVFHGHALVRRDADGGPMDVQEYVKEPRFLCGQAAGCPVLSIEWMKIVARDPSTGKSATFRDVMAGPGWAKDSPLIRQILGFVALVSHGLCPACCPGSAGFAFAVLQHHM